MIKSLSRTSLRGATKERRSNPLGFSVILRGCFVVPPGLLAMTYSERLIQRLIYCIRIESVVCVGLIFIATSACGQSSDDAYQLASPFHAGVRTNYLINYHQSDEQIVLGCPYCGNYSDGSGGGFSAELFGEVPFNFFRRLDLTFAAGFSERGGAAGSIVTDSLVISGKNSQQYVPLSRLLTSTITLNYIDISPGLRLKPFAKFAGYVSAGLDVGIAARSATYQQTETILSPQGWVYPDTHTTSRVDGDVVVNGLNTSFGVIGAIGYEFPLGHSLTASPEISYYYPLNAAQAGFPWHVSSLSFGVAIRWYQPGNYEPPPPPPAPQKPAPPPVLAHEDPNAFAPKLSAVSMASIPFHIIETTVTETFPILPYIFFDSASAVIPDRFAQISSEEASRFKESELPHRSLESYYQLMNVIGSRMQSNPDATLTINGTTDGREVGGQAGSTDPREKTELARARAEKVQDYFRKVWHISPNRLEITTSDAPEHPSSDEFAEGFEENRRVELSSDDDRILKPIVHERFREETALPKVLPVKLSAASSIGVRDWKMVIRSRGVEVFEASGEGNPPSSVDWKPTDGQVEQLAKSLKLNDSLSVDFEASAVNGAHSEQTIAMPASKSINPFELSRLSLIVFDFDQSAIDRQNQRMISQFTGKSFYPASKASIVGSTDNLGELKHNQKLSEDRAFNVRDLILSDKPSAQITSTKGIGPSDLLYDNHLPEGRYYCRTVRVEVETPLDSIIQGQ